MIPLVTLGLLVHLAPPGPAAGAPKPHRLAVMSLEVGFGADPKLTATLSQLLTAELRRRPTLQVFSQEDVRALMTRERQRQILGCSSNGCLAEIGGALGAEEMVSGLFTRVGNRDVLTVRRIDVRRARVIAESGQQIDAADQGALLDAIALIARQLFPKDPAPAPLVPVPTLALEAPEEAPERARPSPVAPLITGLAGVALLAVGAGLLVDTLTAGSSTNGISTLTASQAAGKNTEGSVAVVLLSVGGAFGVGGLVWGLAQ